MKLLYPKICEVCNKPYKAGTTTSKVCSDECRRIFKNREREKKLPHYSRECAECQKPFITTRGNKFYCSYACAKKASRPKIEPHKCGMCGDPIANNMTYCEECYEMHDELRRIYYNNAKNPVRTELCKWCKKPFYTKGTYDFCSDECAHKSMLEDRKHSEAVKRAIAKAKATGKVKRAKERRERFIRMGEDMMQYAARNNRKQTFDPMEYRDSIHVIRLTGNLCVCTTCWQEFVVARTSDSARSNLERRVKSGVSPCPRCGSPIGGELGKLTVSELRKLYPEFDKMDYRPDWFGGLEIDLYSEKYKLGIEFHGIKFHSNRFGKKPSAHRMKADLADKAGIQLLQIYENELESNRECVIDRIDAILGKNMEKVMARKLSVRIMESKAERARVGEFMDRNHIQGRASCTWAVALIDGEDIVACCTFKYGTGYASGGQAAGTEKYWELNRYATKLHTVVQGGLSRCIKVFERTHPDVKNIVSFADRRWTSPTRSAYSSAGFVEIGRVPQNYQYTDLRPYHPLRNKQYMRKSAIEARALHDPSGPEARIFSVDKTEAEMATELGFYRIYDAGKIRYEMSLNGGAIIADD